MKRSGSSAWLKTSAWRDTPRRPSAGSSRSRKPDSLASVEDQVAWLNALILLERRAEIESAAPALVIEGTYLEPFALRALAFARDDADLYERAITALQRMGLDWFVAQTRLLREEGRLGSPAAVVEQRVGLPP
jgi:hypothetical protein